MACDKNLKHWCNQVQTCRIGSNKAGYNQQSVHVQVGGKEKEHPAASASGVCAIRY